MFRRPRLETPGKRLAENADFRGFFALTVIVVADPLLAVGRHGHVGECGKQWVRNKTGFKVDEGFAVMPLLPLCVKSSSDTKRAARAG